MKKIFSILIAIILINIGCGTDKPLRSAAGSFTVNDTISINYQDLLCDSNNGICIQFDSIISDGRCPTGAICVWEGNAAVKLNFKNNLKKHSFVLNTANHPQLPNDTTIGSFTIELIDVSPYPVLDKPVKPEDYQIKVAIRN